jgi:hypothetical protein
MDTTPPLHNPLSDEEKQKLLDQLGSVSDVTEHIDIEHKTTKLTKDDIWRLMAIDAYEKAIKHPMTGELDREDAGVILGFLNQLTDDCLAKEYQNRIGHRSKRMDNARSVLARMVEILCERRGLQKLILTRN